MDRFENLISFFLLRILILLEYLRDIAFSFIITAIIIVPNLGIGFRALELYFMIFLLK